MKYLDLSNFDPLQKSIYKNNNNILYLINKSWLRLLKKYKSHTYPFIVQ